MKTFSAKAHEVQRDWFVIDATDKVLGRVASEVARRLRGKHKPEFTPHVDTGDFIIIVNAARLRVTGNKSIQKVYYKHTGYVGHLKEKTLEQKMEQDPKWVLQHAVRKMLPRNFLTQKRIKNLVFLNKEGAVVRVGMRTKSANSAE